MINGFGFVMIILQLFDTTELRELKKARIIPRVREGNLPPLGVVF
jgi:hypothetical protein